MKKKLLVAVLAAGLVLPSVKALAFDEGGLLELLDDPRPATEIAAEHGIESGLSEADKERIAKETDEKLKEVEKEVSTVPTYTDKDGNVLNPETAGKLASEVVASANGEGEKPMEKPVDKPSVKKLPKTSAVK